LALATFLVLGGRAAPAYLTQTSSGFPIRWGPASPSTIWTDSTKTLTWSFNPIGFPQGGWPTLAQAGAAFQNSFQSLQDTLGTSLSIVRGANSSGTPRSGDGQLQMCFTANQTSDYFGMNITGDIGVTYVTFDATTGALQDADVEINGDPAGLFATWATTGPPAPGGSHDVESTALHEAMTVLGAGHPVYFASAAWPFSRSPQDLAHDRCPSPDDRMLVRTLYPGTPAFSTISGTVTVQGSGAVCNRAIVVVTDGDGVPQATTVTQSDGTYSVNMPSATRATGLTAYSIAAHHYLNSTYNSPTDINFASSTPPLTTNFIAVQPPTGLDTRLSTSGVNMTVTAGTPSLTLQQLSVTPDPLATQVLLLPTTGARSSGTIQLALQNNTPLASISNLSLGPGISVGAPTVTSTGGNSSLISFTYSVSASASPGLRDLSFTTPGGEQLFLPAYVEVPGTGALAVGAGPQNPAPNGATNNQVLVPLLQVTLAASPSEDLRIRQLTFSIAGSGTPLAGVQLWNDRGAAPGIVDGGDAQVFTGNAYFGSSVSEALVPSGPSATLVFDNLSLTVPAGTTVTLLLTGDMASAGIGSYTASFDPTVSSDEIVQGMFWGDPITPSGSVVSGGLVSLGSASITALGQIRTLDSSIIPVGGFTTDTQVTLQGTVTSPSGQVGMEAEVKPLGAPFDGTGTQIQAATAPNGTQVSVVFPGLVSGTSYHWRARGLSSTGLVSPWISFGSNPESSADFSVDQSTVALPVGLSQLDSLGTSVVPVGGSSVGGVILSAAPGADTPQGYAVQVELELRAAAIPFSNTPTQTGPFQAFGTPTRFSVTGTSGTYHWQVRTVDQFGASSAWVPLDPSLVHFILAPFPDQKSKGGCIASAAPESFGGWRLGVLGAAALLFALLPRRRRAQALTLGILFILALPAGAQDVLLAPRSLSEDLVRPDRMPEGRDGSPSFPWEFQGEKGPSTSILLLDLTAGAEFMDTSFKALGKDQVEKNMSGLGAPQVGLEGLLDLGETWQLGLGARASFWRDVRIIGGGPVAAWRFAHSDAVAQSGRFRLEHVAKLQISYESFTNTKSGFGSFDPTIGASLGYELRWNIVHHYSLLVGASVEYAQWKYSPGVLSGDTKVGGLGGFIYIGIGARP
jgi:hypothetical protein